MGREGRGVIRNEWEAPEHRADVHWEFAAGSTSDVGAYPLLPRAVIVGVAADVDRGSEGCESRDNEEGELHCEVSNAGGRAYWWRWSLIVEVELIGGSGA